MRSGIDLIADKAASPSSVFFGKVRPGTHWCGGALRRAGLRRSTRRSTTRVDTAVAIQPGPLNDVDLIDEPVLYLAGQADAIVWPAIVRAMYEGRRPRAGRVSGTARRHALRYGDHGGDMRGPSTAWLRYWLLDDPNARTEFFGASCGYCTDTRQFSDFDRNDLALQIPG